MKGTEDKDVTMADKRIGRTNKLLQLEKKKKHAEETKGNEKWNKEKKKLKKMLKQTILQQ